MPKFNINQFQGLAIDPLTDILYWTDPKYKSIHYVPLNDPDKPYQVFMKFEEKEPQDLAIDSCRRCNYEATSLAYLPQNTFVLGTCISPTHSVKDQA